jgi:hypothetical protein
VLSASYQHSLKLGAMIADMELSSVLEVISGSFYDGTDYKSFYLPDYSTAPP